MCEQCLTDSISYGEILPGFFLSKARKDSSGWKKNQWGLVICNDPEIVWTGELIKDPLLNISDEDINKGNYNEEQELKFSKNLAVFSNELVLPPEVGWQLVEAAKKCGFVPNEGQTLACWLMHYMACWVETHQPLDNMNNYVTN